MASSGAGRPVQRSKASAPWCSSMPRPSTLRSPRAARELATPSRAACRPGHRPRRGLGSACSGSAATKGRARRGVAERRARGLHQQRGACERARERTLPCRRCGARQPAMRDAAPKPARARARRCAPRRRCGVAPASASPTTAARAAPPAPSTTTSAPPSATPASRNERARPSASVLAADATRLAVAQHGVDRADRSARRARLETATA